MENVQEHCRLLRARYDELSDAQISTGMQYLSGAVSSGWDIQNFDQEFCVLHADYVASKPLYLNVWVIFIPILLIFFVFVNPLFQPSSNLPLFIAALIIGLISSFITRKIVTDHYRKFLQKTEELSKAAHSIQHNYGSSNLTSGNSGGLSVPD